MLNLIKRAAGDVNKSNGDKFVFIAALPPRMYEFLYSIQYSCIHHLLQSSYLPSKMVAQLFICPVYPLSTNLYIPLLGSHLFWGGQCQQVCQHLILGNIFILTLFFFNFFFLHLFIFETERDRAWTGEGQRERETQNLKQAPGSERSAQSPTQGSNSHTARSWPEPKSGA